MTEELEPPRPFHPIVPGAVLPGDWYHGRIPANIVAGEGSVVDSAFCFKHYYAQAEIGLRIGRGVTIWRASLAADREATIDIGDFCYIANASLVASRRISIGSHVMIAGGVTIADSDFHPLEPAARVADSIALSPRGDRRHRPLVEAQPVVIHDGVWIGINATILKGVTIGEGAVVAPGSLVVRDVPPLAYVAGNPARAVEGTG